MSRKDIVVGHGENKTLLRGEALEHFLLTAYPNPSRTGCPSDSVVRSIAEGRLPANDPAQLHLASCSECYAEYKHYRMDCEELTKDAPLPLVAPRKRIPMREVVVALAAIAIVVLFLGPSVIHHDSRNPQQIAAVTETVDLSGSGTPRDAGSDAVSAPAITVPARLVHLNILLPFFSEGGSYTVGVSSDRTTDHLLATAVGTTVEKTSNELLLSVDLDLRSVKQGSYFLATVRRSDRGAYFYPLQIGPR